MWTVNEKARTNSKLGNRDFKITQINNVSSSTFPEQIGKGEKEKEESNMERDGAYHGMLLQNRMPNTRVPRPGPGDPTGPQIEFRRSLNGDEGEMTSLRSSISS